MARASTHTLWQSIQISLTLVLAMVVVEAVDILLRVTLGLTIDVYGIQPRHSNGLIGILLSPLLHVHPSHLLANIVPLLPLLTLVFWDQHYRPGLTLALIWLLSGLGTWAIGRPDSLHIGASSLVFGLASFLVTAGVILRNWRTFGVALLVALTYGGLFYGVFPQAGPISWEGHLSGALAGIISALGLRR